VQTRIIKLVRVSSLSIGLVPLCYASLFIYRLNCGSELFVCCFAVGRCPVMLVVGQSSAHLDDTIDMNSKLDPKNSTWVKVCLVYR